MKKNIFDIILLLLILFSLAFMVFADNNYIEDEFNKVCVEKNHKKISNWYRNYNLDKNLITVIECDNSNLYELK